MILAIAILSVSACLVAALIFHDKAARRREVEAKFCSIVVMNAEGEVDFSGSGLALFEA
jgi:hypothetical protein